MSKVCVTCGGSGMQNIPLPGDRGVLRSACPACGGTGRLAGGAPQTSGSANGRKAAAGGGFGLLLLVYLLSRLGPALSKLENQQPELPRPHAAGVGFPMPPQQREQINNHFLAILERHQAERKRAALSRWAASVGGLGTAPAEQATLVTIAGLIQGTFRPDQRDLDRAERITEQLAEEMTARLESAAGQAERIQGLIRSAKAAQSPPVLGANLVGLAGIPDAPGPLLAVSALIQRRAIAESTSGQLAKAVERMREQATQIETIVQNRLAYVPGADKEHCHNILRRLTKLQEKLRL